jgi:hypothetical protein
VVLVLCTVYGKKPAQKQKDHREQLLANHKPVENMAARRMVCRCSLTTRRGIVGCATAHRAELWSQVGMLKMIRNLGFAHRSQHVQQGRFHTEEEVLVYVLGPFPWLLMTVRTAAALLTQNPATQN